MEIIRGMHNLRARHRGCVLTIGNYDGIHRGHQAVIRRLREHALQLNLPAAVLTFEPTPLEFFDPAAAPARLMRFREKAQMLASLGVDRLLCQRFDHAFASLSPEQFVKRLLIDGLAAQRVMVGNDFRFGHERRGDVNQLRKFGEQGGFVCEPMPTVEQGGERVSSTRVREALAAGDLAGAQALLGRPYAMSGRVTGGARLGRKLGVPTANLRVVRKPAPCYGVYAVTAVLADGRELPAAANLGIRPTVYGRDCLLEVHVLDTSENLYGQRMHVKFRHYLRGEARFEDTEQLRAQMQRDIEQARRLLEANP